MQTALLSCAPPVIIHAAPTASPRATCPPLRASRGMQRFVHPKRTSRKGAQADPCTHAYPGEFALNMRKLRAARRLAGIMPQTLCKRVRVSFQELHVCTSPSRRAGSRPVGSWRTSRTRPLISRYRLSAGSSCLRPRSFPVRCGIDNMF